MRIYVSGSVAFDRIMTFPGKFSDHILPDKIHILNVCFLVDGLEEKFGGTAGNIAYSLSLLGEKPTILASAGKDFSSYESWLRKLGLSLDGIRRIDGEFTAGAYITTDQSDNQITGFNPGAMKHPSRFHIDRGNIGGGLAIVSPGNIEDMTEYPKTYKELGVPCIFDPGQQIPALSGRQMTEALENSSMLISNDYELEMIMKATELDRDQILQKTGVVITTLGENGCVAHELDRSTEIPAAKADQVKDPTGAGDSFRSGLLKGLAEKRPLLEAARMGAVCASYCVECYGTQEHKFSLDQFWSRYEQNFGKPSK